MCGAILYQGNACGREVDRDREKYNRYGSIHTGQELSPRKSDVSKEEQCYLMNEVHKSEKVNFSMPPHIILDVSDVRIDCRCSKVLCAHLTLDT